MTQVTQCVKSVSSRDALADYLPLRQDAVAVAVPGNPSMCPLRPAQWCVENATRAYVLTDGLGRIDGFSSWSGQSQCHAKGLTVWCSFRNDAETGSAVVRFRQSAGVWSGVLSVKRRVCLPAWPACKPIP